MILLHNWQIYDYPIPKNEPLSKYITPPKPNNPQSSAQPQSLNTTIQPLILRSPIFSVVFCYIFDQIKSSEPEIHLFPEMTLFQSKLQITLLEQRKQKNYIYQLIKIENCQCYETMLSFSAKIKFIEGLSSKVTTIQKLIGLVGARKLNSHSFHTHSTIKKQLSIEEPVQCQIKYNPKGYSLIKLTRTEDSTSPVWIQNVEILTWLCENEFIKNFESRNVAGKCKCLQLNPKQTYSLMFMLPQNLKGSFQIPINYQETEVQDHQVLEDGMRKNYYHEREIKYLESILLLVRLKNSYWLR